MDDDNDDDDDDDDDDEEEKRFFIPSASWQGPKRGYYFGTTNELGTGYYLDSQQQQQHQQQHQQQPTQKKAKRSVGFADDRNETALIVPSTGEALLAQAEQTAAGGGSSSKIVALTAAGVKAAALALQKAAEHNALQRAKEESSQSTDAILAAEHYMESEIALYENIASLKAFAAEPAALYSVLIQQQVLQQLVQLLMHDNVDIAIAVVSVLLELLDTDLIVNDNDNDNDGRQQAVHQLATALLSSEGPELLVENLARMQRSKQNNNNSNNNKNTEEDEDDDEVGRGVEDILSLVENLLELDLSVPEEEASKTNGKTSKSNNGSSVVSSSTVAATLCRETALVPWLLEQVEQQQQGGDSDPTLRNRSMEVLAYLAPREEIYTVITDWSRIPSYRSTFATAANDNKSNNSNKKKKAPTVDGIEILLQSVAAFRKRQPASEAEVEFLENAAMVLASCLTYSPAAVESFLEAQGIQLVMRCLKERVYAGAVALKWLDFAGSSSSSSIDNTPTTTTTTTALYRRACEELVQAGALKHVFPLFLGRHRPKFHLDKAVTPQQKKDKKNFYHELEATVVRILYALVRHLRDDSPHDAKDRLLAKFLSDNDNNDNSNNNEKVNRLVELLLAYDQRARLAEYKFYRSDVEESLLNSNATTTTTADGDDSDKEAVIQLAALDAKLAAGGDILHRLAVIAAFCCTGSKKCHQQILAQLHAKQSGIGLIREVLEEFVAVLGDSEQKQQLQSYLEQI